MGTLPLSYMPPPNHSFHSIFIQMNGTFFFPKAQEFMSKFKVMTYNTGIWGGKAPSAHLSSSKHPTYMLTR